MGHYLPAFIADSLCPVFAPFWTDLPHSNIFCYISSNILHQLHQGILKDHFKWWCMGLTNQKSFNAQFYAMPISLGLQHFKDGISKVKQWSEGDHKQLQHIFLDVLIGATADTAIVCAGCILLDFIYLAQYKLHMNETLLTLQ